MQLSISELNHQFGLDGVLSFKDAGDGFVVIDVESKLCQASIALQGAHLMTWQPKGEAPVLWMSPVASLTKGASIRGGVPVCWPWFGAHEKPDFPAHGYARRVMWKIVSTSISESFVSLHFKIDECLTQYWSEEVPAELIVRLGTEVELELITQNHTNQPVIVGEALHTYFEVADVRNIVIRGLDGCDYLDSLDGMARKVQQGDITFSEETDRVYLDDGQTLFIDDSKMHRTIVIEKENSHSTVVWNPWIDKCKRMGDFGSDDGYLGMVCVETANAKDDVVTIEPGKSHRLVVRYRVEAL